MNSTCLDENVLKNLVDLSAELLVDLSAELWFWRNDIVNFLIVYRVKCNSAEFSKPSSVYDQEINHIVTSEKE